jgi:transcriptional regulator with XRE-family HTH domain
MLSVQAQTCSPVKPASPELEALGQTIRHLRLTHGLSQEDLAERCEMHRTYIGGIERGERNVGFGNLLKLAEGLDVNPSQLLKCFEIGDVLDP